MNVNEVIKYPILSEKTYAQMASGVYTFAVDKRTNKAEIKKTVEFIFDVKVAKVNVMNVDRKAKRIGKFEGFVSGYKKAIVTLKEGQINIFPEEAVAEEPKKAEVKAEKKEMSEAEKKAAEKIAAKAKEKEEAAKAVETKEAPVKETKETEAK